MRLDADQRLATSLIGLLSQLTERLGGYPLQTEIWQDISGVMVLTWQITPTRSALSYGLADQKSASLLVQAMLGADVKTAAATVADSAASAQPLRSSPGGRWWLRQDTLGFFGFPKTNASSPSA